MFETKFVIEVKGKAWRTFMVPHDKLAHPGLVNAKAAHTAAKIVGGRFVEYTVRRVDG